MALHLPPWALANVFPGSVPISNLGIVTGAGRLGDGCGRPRSARLRAALPGPAAVAVLPPAGSWAPWRLGLPIDCYDLVSGVFDLGAAITWCKLMNDRGVGFGFAEKDQLSALYIWGVGSEGAGDTLECQLGYSASALRIQGASLLLLLHSFRVGVGGRARGGVGGELDSWVLGTYLHRCCRSWDSIV